MGGVPDEGGARRHEGSGEPDPQGEPPRLVLQPEPAILVAGPVHQFVEKGVRCQPHQPVGLGLPLRPHDRHAPARAVVRPHGQDRQGSTGKEVLGGNPAVVALKGERGHDRGLGIIPPRRLDAGLFPHGRSTPVGSDEQARQQAGFAEPDQRALVPHRRSRNVVGPQRHARRPAPSQQGGAEFVVEHHVGEGLTGRRLFAEAEEHRRRLRARPAVGQHDLGDRLRVWREARPHPQGFKEAPGPGGDRDGPKVAPPRARVEARIANRDPGAASEGVPHREGEAQADDAGAGHHHVERFGTRRVHALADLP